MTLTDHSFHLAVAVMQLLIHLVLTRQVLQLFWVCMLLPNNEVNTEHTQPVNADMYECSRLHNSQSWQQNQRLGVLTLHSPLYNKTSLQNGQIRSNSRGGQRMTRHQVPVSQKCHTFRLQLLLTDSTEAKYKKQNKSVETSSQTEIIEK